MDVFDTINRLKVSDDLLKNFITEALSNHYNLKRQGNGTKKSELFIDQELKKSEKQLHSLISIFISVAEELVGKIEILINGPHKNLQRHPFVLMGRIVNTAWIQRKLKDQEERLRRDWPTSPGSSKSRFGTSSALSETRPG